GYDVRGGACEGVASVEVAPASATIVEGATVQLSATPRDGIGAPVAGCGVMWSSDDPPVSTVTADGLVSGVSNGSGPADGSATITATTEGVTGTATITVSDADPVAAFAFAPASPVVGRSVAFTDVSMSADGIQTRVWDFGDGQGSSAQKPSHAYATAGTYAVTLTVSESDGDVAVAARQVVVVVQPPVLLYLALGSSGTLNGVSVANEDIVAFDGTGFSLYFDGSDVGLGSLTLDAFAVISPTEILMSFTSAGTVGGVAMDDSDILKFAATSLGPTTAGTFTMYFDASDVGLSTSDEDVDAVELLPNGHLLVSTTGSFSVTGASGADEDLIEFMPASLGAVTAGSWSLYFDGSDVGLTSSDEDVDAVAIDASGRIFLSTTGAFAVTGRSGADEDVFLFTPTSLGGTTSGSFSAALLFDGSLFGLGGNDVVAIDLP
ncbi:MAG: PKD domain-containing protein, partial [Candidatus Rokuibacteriota bacterium]